MNNLKFLMILSSIVLLFVLPNLSAQVKVEQKRDITSMQNAHFSLEVDAAGGGRIRSWKQKPSERELIGHWKGTYEPGGALFDLRSHLGSRFRAGVMLPGPEMGRLRLEWKHPAGLEVLKYINVRKDSPVVQVEYFFRNRTQAAKRFVVRNWLQSLSSGKLLLTDNQASANLIESKKESGRALYAVIPNVGELGVVKKGTTAVAEWNVTSASPGISVGASNLTEIPPGKELRATLLLVSLTGDAKEISHPLSAKYGKLLGKSSIVPIKGWTDENEKFEITEDETTRSFWLSTGHGDGKQRIRDGFDFDLPLESSRHLYVGVNTLRDIKALPKVEVLTSWQKNIQAFLETEGKDSRELLPISSEPIQFHAGEFRNVWIRISSNGRRPGEYTIPLKISLGEFEKIVLFRLNVWKVKVEDKSPFHVRGYCGGFATLAGGYEITDQKLKRLEAILKVYLEMGGDVLDWNLIPYKVAQKVRLVDTGEVLAEVAKLKPKSLSLDSLPKLDYSYYDPWVELLKRYGVDRIETYMSPPSNPKWQWILLNAVVGKGRVRFDTPEADKVKLWWYREMKRYFEQKGFNGFFCKISDEISPDAIPAYQVAAKLARKAGWRPFTTITGQIARTAYLIEKMDPYCDQWQLSSSLKEDFLAMINEKFVKEKKRVKLKAKWGQYINGGAKDCWATRVFGSEGITGIPARQVEKLEVFEDGKPLQISNHSPWGKKTAGSVYTAGSLKEYLYVIAQDRADPATHKYELRLTLLRPAPEGLRLAPVDETDELWHYGGGSYPYQGTYHEAWNYPVMTIHHGFSGYGFWAFYHWNRTEKIVWINDETAEVTVSPTWCGYRDGWHDARLFAMLNNAGDDSMKKIIGVEEDSLIRLSSNRSEVSRYAIISNSNDPKAVNFARKRALELLAVE